MTRSSTTRSARASPSRRNEAPPIVHALGGSIGSALALLMFYPLERARIELQSRAATSSPSLSPSSSTQKCLINETAAISPIRSADNSQQLAGTSDGCIDGIGIEEDSSWDRAISDSPSSWSMNSGSDDGKSFSGIQSYEEDPDNSTASNSNIYTDSDSDPDSILRCLLDLRKRGVLYKGAKPIISTIFTSQFVFFFLHAYAKRWLVRVSPASTKASSPSLSLLSSCLAGVGNVLLTNPLWVTNMAIVSGTTKTQSLFREFLQLWKTRGPKQLWKGIDASLLLVSNPIIQFVCYEQFKRIILASKARRQQQRNGTKTTNKNKTNVKATLGAAEAFVIAALAKAIATVCTYPLQLTQTLLRMSNNKNNNNNKQRSFIKDERDDNYDEKDNNPLKRQQYKGTIDCLIQLYTTNDAGYAAWFKGMRAKLLQTVLTAAFTFLTYEQILGVVQNVAMYTVRMRQNRVGGGQQKKALMTKSS